MIIKIFNKSKALSYLCYDSTNFINSDITIYDLFNILQYGYHLKTEYTVDIEKNHIWIIIDGSITTVMNVRCGLKYYYGLKDLA